MKVHDDNDHDDYNHDEKRKVKMRVKRKENMHIIFSFCVMVARQWLSSAHAAYSTASTVRSSVEKPNSLVDHTDAEVVGTALRE